VTKHEDAVAIVAFLLLVGVLVAIAGICISAAGAPEIGVVDTWGRVDEAAGRVATWELVLVVLAAVLLATKGDGKKRATLILALVEAVVFATAAVAGALAVFERSFQPDGTPVPTHYYSDAEKIGESAVYAGVLLAVAAVGFLAVRQLRAEQGQASA